LATNVRGAFAAVRAFRPLLEKSALRGGGVVVNLSSAAGAIAMGSNVIYCASKAALDNMTKSLARALAPGIRVVAIAPGLVDTEFVKPMDRRWHAEQTARAHAARPAGHPGRDCRGGRGCDNGLTFATGCVFLVDGGRTLA
jgi:3-oxoacyl-[acyl-carrier protein] reductase